MSPRSVAVLSLATLLGASAPAHAEDLLDYVITAIDPTLAPGRRFAVRDFTGDDRAELLIHDSVTGSGRASYVAMARDLKNQLIHVQSGADGKPQLDGPIVEQLKDGGVIIAGNFVKGR